MAAFIARDIYIDYSLVTGRVSHFELAGEVLLCSESGVEAPDWKQHMDSLIKVGGFDNAPQRAWVNWFREGAGVTQ